MISIEEVEQVMIVLDNEFQNKIFTGNKATDDLKKEIWYGMLKSYSYVEVRKTMVKILSGKVYGVPNITNFTEILKPKLNDDNLGQEFADDLVNFCSKYGTSSKMIEDKILEKYGQIGLDVLLTNRNDLRELTLDGTSTFKSQIRKSFDSKRERLEKLGQLSLSNETQILKIEERVKQKLLDM